MGRWPAEWPRSIHFLGICGSAMSGLAILAARRGVAVRGSDGGAWPPASDMLAAAGIEVRVPWRPRNLDPAPDLVVVGNALSRGNVELERVLEEGWPLCSLPEFVERLLVPGRRVIAVAGTHGKTTTASLVAMLLDRAGRDPSFVVGGRPGNFGVGARVGGGPDLVLEADEYDSAFFDKGPKFLHYWPRVAVLGPVEFDHADIYPDLAAVERAFSLFLRLLPPGGTLVVHGDDPGARKLAAGARCRVVRAGSGTDCEVRIVDREDDGAGQAFGVVVNGKGAGRARLPLPGEHNAQNAAAALAAVAAVGVPPAVALPLLAAFVPPGRRLEPLGGRDGITAFDDFAHHPTAVASTLAALRPRVPAGGRLVACLEPRSNTMVRRVVQESLGRALAGADVVLLGPVDRPDRFSPAERLDVARLAETLRAGGIPAEGPLAPGELFTRLREIARPGDVIVTMSNGAFGGLPGRIRAWLAGAGEGR